jgi:hypothetical protein
VSIFPLGLKPRNRVANLGDRSDDVGLRRVAVLRSLDLEHVQPTPVGAKLLAHALPLFLNGCA